MFLVDRPTALPGIRADLMPHQLFASGDDLVRAALVARPPTAESPAPQARRWASQLDLALPAPSRRRKAG